MRHSFVLTLAIAATAATCRLVPAQEQATLEGHTGLVWSVAFSPDGKILASGGSDGRVNLWDVRSGKKRASFRPFPHPGGGGPGPQFYPVHALAFSPDGKKLALGGGAVPENGENGQLRLWDLAAGKEDAVLKGHRSLVLCVSFSPDGKALASGGDDRTVRLWDTSTGKERAILRGHARQVASVAFSCDGETLASASYDEKVKLWDPRTGRERDELQGQPWPLVFAPDRKTLAYSTYRQGVRIILYEVKEKKERRAIATPDNVRCLAFSPDGETLATGTMYGSQVRVWRASTGKELATFSAHREHVLSVAFSPDGKVLASGGGDAMVRLWDVAKVLEKKRK